MLPITGANANRDNENDRLRNCGKQTIKKAVVVNKPPIEAELDPMSMSELQLAFQLIEESDDGYFAGPQPESRHAMSKITAQSRKSGQNFFLVSN